MSLSEHDRATLDMVYADGGVFIHHLPNGDQNATTLAGRDVSVWRIHRLIKAHKLAAVGDGLFPGTTQSYQVLA